MDRELAEEYVRRDFWKERYNATYRTCMNGESDEFWQDWLRDYADDINQVLRNAYGYPYSSQQRVDMIERLIRRIANDFASTKADEESESLQVTINDIRGD